MTLRRVNLAVVALVGAVAAYLFLRWAFDTPTSAVQSAWTVAGLVGACVTGLNLRDALHDRDALARDGRNGDLKYMADEAIRVELLRLSKMLVFVAIGIYLLESSPFLTQAQRTALHIPEWTNTSILLTAGFFWIILATVVQSILDRRLRLRFYSK